MNYKNVIKLLSRYAILILLALGNLHLFYFIFTPLTVYPVYYLLNVFYDAALLSSTIISFNNLAIEIIPACVAGAAYYLLLILNLTTPMQSSKRIKSIIFLIIAFLALNIIRIVAFAGLLVNGYAYFDITHRMVWYFGSTILVVLIWFVNVKVFRIKEIPVYTDFRRIFREAVKKKRKK